jgi:AmmeMemoRadiSam system protein B
LPFRGLAASSASAFATPLGLVPVDAEAVSRLCALPQINILDEAHTCEHALEVQLPFLQVVLNHFCIVPVLVGDADPQTIDQAIETLWGGPETCVVVSSDLSHYLDSQHARQLDEATAAAIIAGKPEDIGPNQACGRLPLRGLLVAARHHHLRARLLDLRNSGDTTGPRDRVVGYGAFALEAEPPG